MSKEVELKQEGYPDNWKHCIIHLNPETGEMHSDGDHSVRNWIKERISTRPTDGLITVREEDLSLNNLILAISNRHSGNITEATLIAQDILKLIKQKKVGDKP